MLITLKFSTDITGFIFGIWAINFSPVPLWFAGTVVGPVVPLPPSVVVGLSTGLISPPATIGGLCVPLPVDGNVTGFRTGNVFTPPFVAGVLPVPLSRPGRCGIKVVLPPVVVLVPEAVLPFGLLSPDGRFNGGLLGPLPMVDVLCVPVLVFAWIASVTRLLKRFGNLIVPLAPLWFDWPAL